MIQIGSRWFIKTIQVMNKTFSVIVPARNDSHGKHFSKRWFVAMQSIAESARKIGNDVEYIVVDYGSDVYDGTWLDEDFLNDCPKNIPIKFVRVPYEALRHKNKGNPNYFSIVTDDTIVKKYDYGWGDKVDEETTFNHAAILNIGIRHIATGKYIIVTCGDDFFSDTFFKYLMAVIKKDDNTLFICTRVNVIEDEHEYITYDDSITPSQRVKKFNKQIRLKNFQPRKEDILSNVYQGAVGDFQMMSRENWFKFRGYMEYLPHWGYDDVNLCERILNMNYNLLNLSVEYNRYFFYHLKHVETHKNRTINYHAFYPELENPDDWGKFKGHIKVIGNI